MKFEIGEGATIKLDALLSTRLMAQANSGGGKSWLLRRLLEQTHGRVQQFVIDPEGEFATLRQKFDYVLAAKNGGDTLAEPRAAKLLAERLLQLRVSAILDIQELKPNDRIEFVQVFLESLIDAPKSLWRPALVVIDEAHVFCPQGGDAVSSIAVRDLCARGRKRGYCAVLATQRISKLHKDAVAECNNKLIGRASLDVDMKRCGDELGFSKDRWHELRKMKPGEFFAYGPAIETSSEVDAKGNPIASARRVAGQVGRVHVGPVITQHPKIGNRRLRIKTLPPPTRKIKKLLPKLSDLPAESEQIATTAKQLRQKVVELQNELRDAQHAAPKSIVEVERIEVPILSPRVMRQLVTEMRRIEPIVQTMRKIAPAATALERSVNQCALALADRDSRVKSSPQADVLRAAVAGAKAEPVSVVNQAVREALTKPEQRLLDSLAWFEAIGVRTPEQPAAAFMAGYTYGSGAYNNPRGQLKKKGLVEYHHSNQIGLTVSGRTAANYPPRHELATAAQLHQSVLSRLPTPEQRLLIPLLEQWPHPIEQKELAVKANYAFNSGAFNNPRGRLKSLGLIDYPSPGKIVARDLLFPNRKR